MLFSPLKLGSLTLRNRVVMAPMTREAARDGVPTEDMAAYYARRAEGDVGLIITEGTPPDAAGSFGALFRRCAVVFIESRNRRGTVRNVAQPPDAAQGGRQG